MARPPRHIDRVHRLLSRRVLVRAREFEKAGVPRSTLQALVAKGAIERIARGLYSSVDPPITERWTYAEVSARAPHGVFCLLTALGFHQIGTQLPSDVWLAIPPKSRVPRVEHVALRVFRFSGRLLTTGIEVHDEHGIKIRVTTPARTVADCFKFRNTVGLDVAIEALREGWRDRRFRMTELSDMARLCRVSRVMNPYILALT